VRAIGIEWVTRLDALLPVADFLSIN
jgi:hypothetical protein